MTLSELRANIYRVIDRIIQTGETLEIERNGAIVRISAVPTEERRQKRKSAWKRRRDPLLKDPASLVEVNWKSSWSETKKNSIDPS